MKPAFRNDDVYGCTIERKDRKFNDAINIIALFKISCKMNITKIGVGETISISLYFFVPVSKKQSGYEVHGKNQWIVLLRNIYRP